MVQTHCHKDNPKGHVAPECRANAAREGRDNGHLWGAHAAMRQMAVAEENDYQEGKVVKSLKLQAAGTAAALNGTLPRQRKGRKGSST